MWRITLRDLQYRRRRFFIAVLATSVVFAMTLLISGVSKALDQEIVRITDTIAAERWVVADGTSGPFTATTALPGEVVDAVADLDGVRAADPFVFARATVGETDPADVNVLGITPGGMGSPEVQEGRLPRTDGEVLVSSDLGAEVGERISMNGTPMRVVGRTGGLTLFFGNPTVFTTVADAQALMFGGQDLVTAVLVRGSPDDLPQGLVALTDDDVEADTRRVMAKGNETIGFLNILLWLVAAGIIGSIVYMNSLERVRDFAVLKATGWSGGKVVGGLAVQSMALSVSAAIVASVLALLLKNGMALDPVMPGSQYLLLVGIALVVGLVASLAGARRALRVDPALAFGGA